MAAPAPSRAAIRKRAREAFLDDLEESNDRADNREHDMFEREAAMQEARQKRRGLGERVRQGQNEATRTSFGGVDAGGVGPSGSTRASSGGDSGGSARVAELERRVATLEGEKVEFWGFFNAVLMLNANIKATFDSSAKSAGGNVYKQYQTGRGIQKQGDEGN